MKRLFALVILLAALGATLKLASHLALSARLNITTANRSSPQNAPQSGISDQTPMVAQHALTELDAIRVAWAARSWTTANDAELALRMLDKYAYTAVRIEATDGLRGLKLLEALDLNAVTLYESHPTEFRTLRDALRDDDAAATILLQWRDYFGTKLTDHQDRRALVNAVASLPRAARKAAAEYPNALPLLLTDPQGVLDLINDWRDTPERLGDVLAILSFADLESGGADLRIAVRGLRLHGPLAMEAYRVRGISGFILVCLYGDLIQEIGDHPPLNDVLTLIEANSDDLDQLLRIRRPDDLARLIRHVAAVNLVKEVGGAPQGLRFVSRYGEEGEKALRQVGSWAVPIVSAFESDPTLANQAVRAMAVHGQEGYRILSKYADDADFRLILKTYGPAVIPPIARVDQIPETLQRLKENPDPSLSQVFIQGLMAIGRESGQGVIQTIKDEGMERVAWLHAAEGLQPQELLPLYEVVNLANVLSRGWTPSMGELTFALFDVAFIIMDVVSLGSLQPEGVAAIEAARTNLRSSARATLREVGEGATTRMTGHPARDVLGWTGRRLAVEQAGGLFATLKRLPEVLPKLTPGEMADLARPLATKLRLNLARFAPVRLLHSGVETVRPIAIRGTKYMSDNLIAAGVGIVAISKMEEYLQSRRAPHPSRTASNE